MAIRNKHEQQPASEKTDDQIINDLIENRKRQMEALIKIMTSIDEPTAKAAIPDSEAAAKESKRYKK